MPTGLASRGIGYAARLAGQAPRVERVDQQMTVLIACIEDSSVAIRMEGRLPDYSHATHEFSLNRPIGDDWGQYIRHVPNPPPLIVRTEESTSFVVFDRRDDAERFEQWLIDAREEQDRGFRTMRG